METAILRAARLLDKRRLLRRRLGSWCGPYRAQRGAATLLRKISDTTGSVAGNSRTVCKRRREFPSLWTAPPESQWQWARPDGWWSAGAGQFAAAV